MTDDILTDAEGITGPKLRAEAEGRICVITNPGSGRNSRDAAAVERAMEVFGPRAELRAWSDSDSLSATVERALADGFATIVAAGGDGTIMGVAQAMVAAGNAAKKGSAEAGAREESSGEGGAAQPGKRAKLAVLPLGTFNYFARGLGLPQEPDAAAQAILEGASHRISVGAVNGQVFLNNASLGVYPSILKAREAVYDRWGRRRILAHWSTVKTFLRFQHPMRVTITADGKQMERRTALIFVARSAYQLESYGLKGAEAISDDRFAVFVAHDGGRGALFRLAWRLVRKRIEVGRDVEYFSAREIEIDTRAARPLVAFDGEKSRMKAPLSFRILPDALTIVVPEPQPADSTGREG